MPQFSEKLSALMRRRGTTTRALGAAVGVSSAAVTGWAKGANPRHELIAKIADFFGVAADILTNDALDLPPEPGVIPDWWAAMPPPEESERLRVAVPHVYERLKIAAERLYMGDLAADHGRKRTPEQEHPLIDAFADLGLQGTGFTSQLGFQVLANVYTHELHLLRTQPLEERLAEQAREITRTRSTLEELREWLLGAPAETAAAKAKLAELKERARGEGGPAEHRRQA